MTQFLQARNGESTVRLNGTLLHSSYAPGREAARVADSLPRRRCYLILGEGMGHLSEALASRFPDARLLTLHPDQELTLAAADTPGAHWGPDSRETLEEAINRAFGEEGVYGFELVPWEAGRRASPQWYAAMEDQILAVARRRHNSLLTTGYFGRAWLRNAVRNLEAHREHRREAIEVATDSYPVIVAPGTTLEGAIPFILRNRSSLYLIAVSSALPILQAHQIRPDIVVHTDGGFWARYHLIGSLPPPALLAVSPRAAIPPGLRSRVGLLLPDAASLLEVALAEAGQLPLLPLPGHGTVTGTALYLSQKLFDAPALLVGVDLATRGYRSHCRGHGFESLIWSGTSRLSPLPTLLRRRLKDPRSVAEGWEQGEDLEVYRRAIAGELASSHPPAIRYAPSPVELPGTAVSGDWTPPGTETRRTISASEGNGDVMGLLKAVALRFSAEGLERASGSLEEEVARHLALPELLRLRKAASAGGELSGARDAVATAVHRGIEAVIGAGGRR